MVEREQFEVIPRLGGERSLPELWHSGLAAAEWADFELPLLDLLCQFDATNDDHRGSEALQPQHRTKPLLDSAMVSFNQIIQVSTAAQQHPFR